MAEPITNVLGTVAIKHCGAYDATVHYEKLNVVTYNGSSYCAKDNTIGNLPTDTTYWDLMAEKGLKGNTGSAGYTPVKGTDYYTADDIADLEDTLSEDVHDEVSTQLGTLTSATPLVASSTANMTDTTRVYVNSTDGHWYWHNGTAWTDGGTYQATGLDSDVLYRKTLNKKVFGNLFKFDGTRNYALLVFQIADSNIGNVTSIKVKGKIYVKRANIAGTTTKLLLRRIQGYVPSTGNSWAQYDLPNNNIYNGGPLYMGDAKEGYIPFECEATGLSNVALNAIDFRWNYINTDSPLQMEYYVKDIEVWINGNYIDNVYMTTNLETYFGSDITPEKDFLVRKSDFETIEEKVEELNVDDILNKYESSSKSDLFNISCWGDSLTEGGSAGTPYPTYLKNMINNEKVTVNNFGRSGECSGIIAFRQGGNVITVADDFVIPTSGDVEFTYNISSGGRNNTNRFSNLPVSIAGVSGKVRQSGSNMIFTRDTSGEAVTVDEGTQVISPYANHTEDMVIIWVGRNDMAFSWPTQITGVIDNIRAMLEHLTPKVKRFLIISCTTTTNEEEGGQSHGWVMELNEKLAEIYPNNFVDIENYLVNQCIYDMGITPTEEDLQKMEAGTIPPSLMADFAHPNSATREYIARYIYNVMLSKDWIK